MTTERERYLLTRCLRLEARILQFEGTDIAVLPPLAVTLPPLVPPVRARQRRTTKADIAQMRALRARGYSYSAIGRSLRFSNSTARRHTIDTKREAQAA